MCFVKMVKNEQICMKQIDKVHVQSYYLPNKNDI